MDPLAGITAAWESGLWLYLLPAWILLGLTALSGRFFCGWICPLGSAVEMLPSLESRRARKISRLRPRDIFGRTIRADDRRIRLKYGFRGILLRLFSLGINARWIFDPLVVANRAVIFVLLGGVPFVFIALVVLCLLYTSPSPRDRTRSRMPSSA